MEMTYGFARDDVPAGRQKIGEQNGLRVDFTGERLLIVGPGAAAAVHVDAIEVAGQVHRIDRPGTDFSIETAATSSVRLPRGRSGDPIVLHLQVKKSVPKFRAVLFGS